jgi:ABC-2 type transport system ATP-binding protein
MRRKMEVEGMSSTPRSDFVCSGASIRVEKLSRRFGKVQALDNLSLNVDPGTVFALLGPNGSGKTTLVRVLTTLLRPDSGAAFIGDYNVVDQANAVRSIIGLAGQYPAVDENLTGRENLQMIGQLYHMGAKVARARGDELLELFNLTDAANRRAKTYSGGMRRRLDLAAALVARPPILLLDEPTTGLDPRSRLGLWDVIAEQARSCNTVFLTTQYLEEADRLAGKVAIMESGRVVRTGTPKELKESAGGGVHARIRLADRSRTNEAVELLRTIGGREIRGMTDTGEITFPSSSGAAVLTDVVRRMDGAGIAVAEIGITQPTLDDVFLAITGHGAEQQDEGAPRGPKVEER